ncbi:sensor histidine kinase [Actinomadura craniellae]|nr:HAMP domain-containing sensor histidine kinase [Actinomadura craniellae]
MLATGVMLLLGLLMSVLADFAVRSRVEDYQRNQITDTALQTAHMAARNRLPPVLPADGVEGVQVVDARGRVVAASANLRGRPRIAHFTPADDLARTTRLVCPSSDQADCLVVMALRVYRPGEEWLVYAADGAVPWYVAPEFIAADICVLALFLLLTAYITSRAVGRTLAPVAEIRAQLAEITATDPGRRLPLPQSNDEIRRLAETANATLDRLEAAMDQLRRFTSDASHDLRSPMTAMRAQVEEALLHPDDTDWPQLAHATLEGLDRLQAIVTDLLTLARLDAGPQRGSDRVDLTRLVTDELDRRHPTVKVTTNLQPGVVVTGNRLRLARLLTNLIDNAERHAASRIKITVRAERDAAVLEVQDDGQGILPKDREAIFQRFVRLDSARRLDSSGTGLGLPIARQIAEAHGGTLTIEESFRGALFRLRIPFTCPPP